MMSIKNKFIPILVTLILLCLMLISYSNAASVRMVSMDEMLNQCQFVFEGNVLAIESKEDDKRRIHTYVTIKINDVIKGSYLGDIMKLSFLGGSVGARAMKVSDMVLPKVGEHGIYFVESLERSQVNPLYGWSQGHFLIETSDADTDQVMTNKRQLVIDIINDNTEPNTDTIQALSKGVANGLSIAKKGKEARGLTSLEFKNALRERLRTINEKN